MKSYVVFDADGRIVRTGECPEEMVNLQCKNDGEQVIEGVAECLRHYVVNGLIANRPNFAIVADEVVGVDQDWHITNIPAGTFLTYPGGSAVVNDGNIQWSSSEIGDFKFTLSLWPYVPKELYVRVQ